MADERPRSLRRESPICARQGVDSANAIRVSHWISLFATSFQDPLHYPLADVRDKLEGRIIAEIARERGKEGLNLLLDLTSSTICN